MNNSKPLRTVIYLRKSTKDKDEKQVHSIERQMREIQNFLERHNAVYPLHEQFSFDPKTDLITEDASAKETGRPKFNEMIERIKRNKYDALLCFELARLSRNALDNGTLVQILDDMHLQQIRTVGQPFRATPTDKFTLTILLGFSKMDNDQRAVNTKSGMANQKSKGETTHRAPMGYVNAGNKKGQKWVEKDAQCFEGVKKLWGLMLTGDYVIADIHRVAMDMGLTYSTGKGRKQPTEGMYRYLFVCRPG